MKPPCEDCRRNCDEPCWKVEHGILVEVVRCKDCKYCDISLLLPNGRKMYTCMDGVHDHQMLMKPYDFCSNGKRREGANNEV